MNIHFHETSICIWNFLLKIELKLDPNFYMIFQLFKKNNALFFILFERIQEKQAKLPFHKIHLNAPVGTNITPEDNIFQANFSSKQQIFPNIFQLRTSILFCMLYIDMDGMKSWSNIRWPERVMKSNGSIEQAPEYVAGINEMSPLYGGWWKITEIFHSSWA